LGNIFIQHESAEVAARYFVLLIIFLFFGIHLSLFID